MSTLQPLTFPSAAHPHYPRTRRSIHRVATAAMIIAIRKPARLSSLAGPCLALRHRPLSPPHLAPFLHEGQVAGGFREPPFHAPRGRKEYRSEDAPLTSPLPLAAAGIVRADEYIERILTPYGDSAVIAVAAMGCIARFLESNGISLCRDQVGRLVAISISVCAKFWDEGAVGEGVNLNFVSSTGIPLEDYNAMEISFLSSLGWSLRMDEGVFEELAGKIEVIGRTRSHRHPLTRTNWRGDDYDVPCHATYACTRNRVCARPPPRVSTATHQHHSTARGYGTMVRHARAQRHGARRAHALCDACRSDPADGWRCCKRCAD